MELEFKKHACIECGVTFCITKEHDTELLRNKKSFYCPNGHRQSYTGKTDKQLLHEEKQKSQRYYGYFEEEQQTVKNLLNKNRALKGHVTRLKKT